MPPSILPVSPTRVASGEYHLSDSHQQIPHSNQTEDTRKEKEEVTASHDHPRCIEGISDAIFQHHGMSTDPCAPQKNHVSLVRALFESKKYAPDQSHQSRQDEPTHPPEYVNVNTGAGICTGTGAGTSTSQEEKQPERQEVTENEARLQKALQTMATEYAKLRKTHKKFVKSTRGHVHCVNEAMQRQSENQDRLVEDYRELLDLQEQEIQILRTQLAKSKQQQQVFSMDVPVKARDLAEAAAESADTTKNNKTPSKGKSTVRVMLIKLEAPKADDDAQNQSTYETAIDHIRQLRSQNDSVDDDELHQVETQRQHQIKALQQQVLDLKQETYKKNDQYRESLEQRVLRMRAQVEKGNAKVHEMERLSQTMDTLKTIPLSSTPSKTSTLTADVAVTTHLEDKRQPSPILDVNRRTSATGVCNEMRQ